jgi:hypothetical protein
MNDRSLIFSIVNILLLLLYIYIWDIELNLELKDKILKYFHYIKLERYKKIIEKGMSKL